MIIHKITNDGGFVCGDTETRMTAYAFPKSTYATHAKHNPAKIAAKMLGAERRHGFPHEADYDARMWARLG